MKIKYIVFIICIGAMSYCNSQQLQDENSALINAYFNQGHIEQNQAQEQKNSLFSKTDLFQVGDNNYINVNSSFKDKLEVVQQGNENFYEFIGYYGSKNSSMQIFQTGNNNGIYIYGENDLTKNLIINQKTDNQHIFITNYK